MKKRILSILLCLCMVLTLCPVTAFAEGETCTVTFDMNGREGNGTSPAPLTVPKGSKIEAPASPSQDEEFDGYSFVKWYVKDSGIRWYFDVDTVQSDLTLCASWVDYPPVTIRATLDGEPYPGLTVEYRSTSAEGLTYMLTETSAGIYQYNGIKPDYYEFYVNNKYYADEIVNQGTISYSVPLQFYSVTFDANGQEFTEETAPASKLCWKYDLWYDRSINKPADPVAKDSNYRFIGWTVGSERDSGAFDFVATSIRSTTVIYAQWDLIVDENTFPVTAERATIVGSSHAKRGEDYHATLVPAAGYELPFRMTSHYYEQYYTHIKIGGQILNTANYTLNLDTGELTIPGEYITNRVEIVAVPRQNPYIVHFNANGGTGTQEGEGAKVYTDYKGYDYLYHQNTSGWYTLPSCTLTPPDGKMFSHWTYGLNYTNVLNPGKRDMVFGDKTYYAIWKDAPEGTYTVAYNLTGCKFSGSTNASNGSDYTTVITPKDGYAAPITLSSVQVGGKTLDSSEYLTTQDSETGALTLTVPGDKITGNMIITASAEPIYTVSFNTDGGTIIPPKTTVRWTDTVLDGVSEPTKDGWKFIGWKYGEVPVTPQTTYKDLAVEDTVLSVELEAQWEDIAAPTGEISIGENSWKAFLNEITFGLFFKDTQTVTITASDNSGEAVPISYLLSDQPLAEDKLAAKEFNTYTDGFDIEPNNEWIIYAKLTDKAGNVRYLSSDGIVLDNVVPVISGIENGKTYCEAQTVTVDEKYIDSVTVNGTKVPLDKNSRFTLSAAEGTQTIVATDKAGNETSVTVTVNDGHTYEWQSENGQYWKKCKLCDDETAKKDIPTITINGADAVCVTQDYKFSFTLPEGATDALYGYDFEYMGASGLEPVTEDGKLYGAVPAADYDLSANSFKVTATAKTADGFEFSVSKTVALMSEHTDAAPKDHICDICGATLSEHTGGEATCTDKAVCEYCDEKYGEVDSSNHDLENIPAKAATVTETGNIEYWHCKDCDKCFADENGENEIELADTIIAKLPPEIIEGKGQSITAEEKKELSFTSNAAFSDFIRVELDGKTLDEKNYTVKKGSTVVTLKADYVATLSVGEHTIGIASESGTAATTFTVNAKAAVNDNINSLPTGDNSNLAMWIALLLVSGGAGIATTVVSRKKKRSAR